MLWTSCEGFKAYSSNIMLWFSSLKNFCCLLNNIPSLSPEFSWPTCFHGNTSSDKPFHIKLTQNTQQKGENELSQDAFSELNSTTSVLTFQQPATFNETLIVIIGPCKLVWFLLRPFIDILNFELFYAGLTLTLSYCHIQPTPELSLIWSDHIQYSHV